MRCSTGTQSTSGVQPFDFACTTPSKPSCAYLSVAVLQRISRETGLPILYLSYDSQTSDTGLDTRLEAFYDMLAMKKGLLASTPDQGAPQA